MTDQHTEDYLEKLFNANPRRARAPEGECKYCDEERARGNGFHPYHDASANCQSGKHSHCSCDTCF